MSSFFKIRRGFDCIKSGINLQKRLQQTQRKYEIEKWQDNVPVFRNATHFAEKIALKDSYGNYTYGNLFISANQLSRELNKEVDGKKNERVLFLCPNDAHYIITQWAIWLSGQIAVPLNANQPSSVIEYYCEDSDAKLLVTTKKHADVMQAIAKKYNKKLFVLDDTLRKTATRKIPKCMGDLEGGMPLEFYEKSNAMILYTSGTTGKPKGVVLSHKNLQSQTNSLIEAWKWSNSDVILHCLPLNHTHGIINALLCPLNIGAKVIMMNKFDKNITWSHLLGINTATFDRVTIFMGVPTMYYQLIDEYEHIFKKNQRVVDYIRSTLKNKVRLMVSGSAPLPIPIFQQWEKISGHRILERYGMTEIGMCLSNEYHSQREPGYVGVPLPGVTVKLAKEQEDGSFENLIECSNVHGRMNIKKYSEKNEYAGELFVKGDSVFKEYFNKPAETKKEFTPDGWFRTGDTAKFNINKKLFKLLGRTSTDIIKSGGYKISAIQIETYLMGHPDITDCTVVGVEDPVWGQRVAAVVVLRKDASMTLEQLRKFGKQKVAEYAVPSVLKIVDKIPKNQMGKVNKKDIVKQFFS